MIFHENYFSYKNVYDHKFHSFEHDFTQTLVLKVIGILKKNLFYSE